MRFKFSILITLAALISIGFVACKAKKGAGSANVRTLSLKAPGMYTFSFAGKTTPDASVSAKELSTINKVKILSQGKEVQNVSVKFKMKLLRDDIETGSAENDGTDLSVQVMELMKSATAGDKISFEAIRIIPQGGEAISYPPINFSVK
jgi:hypothetical protein